MGNYLRAAVRVLNFAVSVDELTHLSSGSYLVYFMTALSLSAKSAV